MAAIAQKERDEIIALAQSALKSDGITDARLIEWLDIWIGRIAEHKEWDVLYQEADISTIAVPPTTTYALPDGTGADPRVHQLFRVFLDDATYGRTLEWEAPTLFDERHQAAILLASSTAAPKYYTVRNFTMSVFPIPDAIYTLRACYNRVPNAMSTAASKCEIYGIDDALFCFIVSAGYHEIGERENAAKYEQMGWQRIDGTRTELVDDESNAVEPYYIDGGSYTSSEERHWR